MPSRCTTHAPHWLVSQPICVPVSRRVSRRKSTSSVRGSAWPSTSLPFTRKVMGADWSVATGFLRTGLGGRRPSPAPNREDEVKRPMGQFAGTRKRDRCPALRNPRQPGCSPPNLASCRRQFPAAPTYLVPAVAGSPRDPDGGRGNGVPPLFGSTARRPGSWIRTPSRAHAHAFVDWMADYLAGIEQRPVRAQVRPGDVLRLLPAEPPAKGEPMEEIFAAFERDILPGVTHWQHPRFFAYFPANASPPSVLGGNADRGSRGQLHGLGDVARGGRNLRRGYSNGSDRCWACLRGFEGVIQDSASSATLVALLAACQRATDGAAGVSGLAGHRVHTVYASAETHSSIDKGMMVAGLGRKNLRKIPTDSSFALRPEALADMIRQDREAGLIPTCVVATLGTTAVGGIDPLAGHRRDHAPGRPVPSRGCRMGWQRPRLRGVPAHARRGRRRRQSRVQPAQMAAHQLRLFCPVFSATCAKSNELSRYRQRTSGLRRVTRSSTIATGAFRWAGGSGR